MSSRFQRVARNAGLLAFLRSLFAVSLVLAASGDLDSTFSSDGLQKTDFANHWGDELRGAALQSDGKIVAAGSRWDPAHPGAKTGNFAVARYKPNGGLDNTFSSNGRLTTNFGASEYAYDVVIQSNGRIVVSGRTCSGGACDLAVARYKANGALDASFSGDGKKKVAFGTGNNGTTGGLAIQPDDKIVVAGYMWNGTDYDHAVYRLNPNGSLDSSFSGDGRQSIDYGTGRQDFSYDLVLQGTNIVVAGHTCDASYLNCDMAVARLTSTGELDDTFSGDGILTIDFGADDYCSGLALQADDMIVAVGESYNDPTDVIAVARIDTNGVPDSTFSSDGLQTVSIGTEAWAQDVIVQADDNIVIAGTGTGSSSLDFALVRMDSSGAADMAFSGDGQMVIDFSGFQDYGRALLLQGDGRYVLGGGTNNAGQWDFGLARVLP